MDSTRSLFLPHDARPERADNESTCVAVLRHRTPAVEAVPFREAFVRNFRQIRSTVCGHPRPGVAVLAASGSGMHGSIWLAADSSLRTAIIGRHGKADLFLADDPSLSLRHLAVFVTLQDGLSRLRVIDLRSECGSSDEQGRRFGAIDADGPAFLSAGNYRLFLFPTPAPLWPDDAETAWDDLLPRRFLDEQLATAPPPRRDRRQHTSITIVPGPLAGQGNAVEAGEVPLGHLFLTRGPLAGQIAIGPRAASRGVLLGRYARCDAAGLLPLQDDSLSRVHALILSLDGRLHLVDTASTNGLRNAGAAARSIDLYKGDRMQLALVAARWTPADAADAS